MKNKARLILLILSSFLIAGNGTGQRFTRTLGIPGPGWISIPVDGHMWRYAGSTLDIVDSAGTHLSRKIVFPEDRPPVTPSLLPVLHDLEIQNDRAILSLTLQGATVNHHRLIVQFDRPSYVPWAILEASPDRRNWKELARGKLFTLNLRDSLTQSALDYPPTDARYLRLILHGEDRNLPAIRQIQVLAHREADPWDAEVVPLLPVDSEMVEAMGEPSISAGRPDLPPWPLEARTLELPLEKNHPPFTVTFWNLVNGSLNRGYACVLRPGVTTVPVPGGTLHSPMLVSWDQKIGEMKEVTVKRYPKVLAVYAEHPGALSVSYGGVEKSPDRTLQIPPDSNRPVYDLSPPGEAPRSFGRTDQTRGRK